MGWLALLPHTFGDQGLGLNMWSLHVLLVSSWAPPYCPENAKVIWRCHLAYVNVCALRWGGVPSWVIPCLVPITSGPPTSLHGTSRCGKWMDHCLKMISFIVLNVKQEMVIIRKYYTKYTVLLVISLRQLRCYQYSSSMIEIFQVFAHTLAKLSYYPLYRQDFNVST